MAEKIKSSRSALGEEQSDCFTTVDSCLRTELTTKLNLIANGYVTPTTVSYLFRQCDTAFIATFSAFFTSLASTFVDTNPSLCES